MSWEEYEAAFRTHVADQIRADPAEEEVWHRGMRAKQARAKRGKVSKGDGYFTALWSTMLYQWGHIDAFTRLLGDCRPKVRLDGAVVLDLGCGGGTVGVALGLHDANASFTYIGVDHNVHAQKVARAILRSDGVVGAGCSVVTRRSVASGVVKVLDLEPDHVIMTASYLFRQDLDTAALSAFADGVVDIINAGVTSIDLLVSDATYGPTSSYEPFVAELKDRGVSVRCRPLDSPIHHVTRYPSLYPDRKAYPYSPRNATLWRRQARLR